MWMDGWLDLFIANESTPGAEFNCELFMNMAGVFTEASTESGLTGKGFYKGVCAADFTNDGLTNLYLSTYDSENILYINKYNNGVLSFQDKSAEAGVQFPIHSFPTWSFDYNNDGYEDIFVSGYVENQKSPVVLLMTSAKKNSISPNRPFLYRNNGDGTFTEVSAKAGIREASATMGCNFGDLDNDGFLDFYLATGDPSYFSIVPNKVYHNNKNGTFEDVTYAGGFGHIQKGHAVGFGDLDMDGDQDVYVVLGGAYDGDIFQNILYENPLGNENKWTRIRLVGIESNRSAIGAKLELTISENNRSRKIYHTLGSDASFGGNSLLAEIGLGQTDAIVELKVTWPRADRGTSVYSQLPLNSTILISEDKENFEVVNIAAIEF